MNIQEMIFHTIGGLALFLFGMGMLSDGLKKAAGDRLRSLLEKVTRRPIFGLAVGAGITALIQSSSATTVMVIGLVNAALLTLKQAICVILGANIGTTMTAWVVSAVAGTEKFKISTYALPIIALGMILQFVGKRQRVRHIGQILIGFGILFVGIDFMKGAFGGLKVTGGEVPEHVKNVMSAVARYPLLAVLAGTLITVLIQSSSASIMIIQVLAFQGIFSDDWETAFRIALPFVLGDNIGTTITAQLASLRTNVNARRAAMAHTLFNVLGVCWILPLAWSGWFPRIVSAITPWSLGQNTIMLEIAFAHSAFNIANAIAFLPLVGVLEKVVVKLTPKGRGVEIPTVTLERHLLNTPPLAIDQARREIVRMSISARDAVRDAIAAIANDDRRLIAKVAKTEDAVDDFQTQITCYLVELSQRTLSPRMANELPVLLHTVNDLERVSDHAVNITEIATRKIDQRETFSPAAGDEIEKMRAELEEMFDEILPAIDDSDVGAAERALRHEDVLNRMQMDYRRSHVQRLSQGKCSPIAGLIFVDIVDNMEKIGDHLTNIAQGVIAGLQWSSAHNEDAAPAPAAED